MDALDVAHRLIAVLETDGEGIEFDSLLLFFGLLAATQDEATMRAIAETADPQLARDPWESTIVAWLRDSVDWRHSTVTLLDVVGAAPRDRNAETRIRRIMIDRLGWRPGLVPAHGGKRIRGYVRSED